MYLDTLIITSLLLTMSFFMTTLVCYRATHRLDVPLHTIEFGRSLAIGRPGLHLMPWTPNGSDDMPLAAWH